MQIHGPQKGRRAVELQHFEGVENEVGQRSAVGRSIPGRSHNYYIYFRNEQLSGKEQVYFWVYSIKLAISQIYQSKYFNRKCMR